MDGQDLFVPAPTGQQGEQQAHCAPKSALPLSTRAVLLGLPRSCLTPSRLDEHPECAGCMNRLLHVLLTCALACACGPPNWSPGSGQTALREDLPKALFSQT